MNYLEIKDFGKNVKALTTTLEFGNMAYQASKNVEHVSLRRGKLAKDLNIDIKHIVFTHQTNSDVLKYVDEKDYSKGMKNFESGVEADALYTDKKNIALAIFHADCVPLFVYVEKIPLICIIHAGYKGTLKHISYKAIDELKNKYNLNGEDFKVVLGPSRNMMDFFISEEEKKEIYAAKLEKAVRLNDEKPPLFDLSFANIIDLTKAGIPFKNIRDIDINTVDDPNCFSVYNKEKKQGRMCSLILLK